MVHFLGVLSVYVLVCVRVCVCVFRLFYLFPSLSFFLFSLEYILRSLLHVQLAHQKMRQQAVVQIQKSNSSRACIDNPYTSVTVTLVYGLSIQARELFLGSLDSVQGLNID